MARRFELLLPVPVPDDLARLVPGQTRLFHDPAQAPVLAGIDPCEERCPEEGREEPDPLALRYGPRVERVAAPHRLADGIVHVAPVVEPEPARLARRIGEDVDTFPPRSRDATHHHRQHRAHGHRYPGLPGELHRRVEDQGAVRTAQRGVDLERQRAVVPERPRVDARARRQQCAGALPRAELGEPLLQVVQAIDSPVPLATVVEHRAGVVPETLAAVRPRPTALRQRRRLDGRVPFGKGLQGFARSLRRRSFAPAKLPPIRQDGPRP